MTWLCAESQWNHAPVPADLLEDAESKARQSTTGGNLAETIVAAVAGATSSSMEI